MKKHLIQALEYSARVGSDGVGVIDTEEKLAAAMVFIELNGMGLVIATIGGAGPTYRLANAGRVMLEKAA